MVHVAYAAASSRHRHHQVLVKLSSTPYVRRHDRLTRCRSVKECTARRALRDKIDIEVPYLEQLRTKEDCKSIAEHAEQDDIRG